MGDTEQRLQKLEEAMEKMQHENQRLHAVNEIQNLISTYEYLHTANMHKESTKLFAKRADTRVYFGEMGYYEGADAPHRAFSMLDSITDNTGLMALQVNTTPVIVVAGDCQTAKGVWVVPGIIASLDRETGGPKCNIEIHKYGVDFIREDGEWKIWHHHIYRIIHRLGWDEPWVAQFTKPDPGPLPGLKIDGPAVDHNPYRPDTKQGLVPEPPKPYETFDPGKMY